MAVIFVSSNIWIELRFPLEPYYINCINLLSHVYLLGFILTNLHGAVCRELMFGRQLYKGSLGSRAT